MASNIVSLAYVRSFEGQEQQTLKTLHELYGMMARKGYSRDLLYRDAKDAGRLVHLRYWKSQEARQQAQEDPEVHRLWQRLAETSEVQGVIERLEEIPDTWSPKS